MAFARLLIARHQRRQRVITLIENAEVFAPTPLGRQTLLLLGDTIARIGAVDRSAADALGVDYEVVDASHCHLCPGAQPKCRSGFRRQPPRHGGSAGNVRQ